MNKLTGAALYRPGLGVKQFTCTKRTSIDFQIDSKSLLQLLDKASNIRTDMVGCFVKGEGRRNEDSAERLRMLSEPDTPSGRTILYCCAECFDLGCGAYSALISKTDQVYVWRHFAYEDYTDEVEMIAGVGPFSFVIDEYEEFINSLASF